MKSFDVTPWLPGNYKEKTLLDAAVLNAEFHAAGACFDVDEDGELDGMIDAADGVFEDEYGVVKPLGADI